MATKYDKRIERILERDRVLEVVCAPMPSDDPEFLHWQLMTRARGAVAIQKESALL